MKTPTFQACGKVILCGEHFVLHGAPAIALPAPTLCLRLKRLGTGDVSPGGADPILLEVWNVAREHVGLGPDGIFPFFVESTIPVGVGLGSSAAVSVALVRAAVDEAGCDVDPVRVMEMASRIEDVFHGRSSGLDPAVVVSEKPILWTGNGDSETLEWRLDARELLVAVVAVEGTTEEAVARSRAYAKANTDRFEEILSEVRSLTLRIADLLTLQAGDIRRAGLEIGSLLSRNHELLAETGVSCRSLDALVGAARAAGALGAKLTGAGLGGCALALVESDRVEDVSGALQRAGAMDVFRFSPSQGPAG